MDLLYRRYASPFSFIDGMLHTGRFCEFVFELWNTHVKEKDEQTTWEFFVHKVWDKSFADFKEELRVDKQNREMTANDIETTVQESLDILNNFKPND